jgi:hypothetical protein
MRRGEQGEKGKVQLLVFQDFGYRNLVYNAVRLACSSTYIL